MSQAMTTAPMMDPETRSESPPIISQMSQHGKNLGSLTARVERAAGTLGALADDLHGTAPEPPTAEVPKNGGGRMQAIGIALALHEQVIERLERQVQRVTGSN